jgi:hypothetical protein
MPRERTTIAAIRDIPCGPWKMACAVVAARPSEQPPTEPSAVLPRADPARWSKGAVVAVHCPEDDPAPFWLCRIDEDADGSTETAISWLEPTGKARKTYMVGGKDPVATRSIICVVREAGRWDSGRGFTLTPVERAAVVNAIEAEARPEEQDEGPPLKVADVAVRSQLSHDFAVVSSPAPKKKRRRTDVDQGLSEAASQPRHQASKNGEKTSGPTPAAECRVLSVATRMI